MLFSGGSDVAEKEQNVNNSCGTDDLTPTSGMQTHTMVKDEEVSGSTRQYVDTVRHDRVPTIHTTVRKMKTLSEGGDDNFFREIKSRVVIENEFDHLLQLG